MRAMLDMWHHLAPGGTIGSQLVGDDALWSNALLFQQPGQQSPSGLGVATGLNDFIQNVAILINGPPQPVLLAANGDDGFIEIPFVAKLSGRSPPDFIGKAPTEFLGPKADCLVRDNDPARRQ